MGVKGLWKLLDGTGRPVSLEALEGKILAVDISVWLNMAIKGMRDYHGHAMTNAHLITLFTRICKLLYYGVKPVFVFDGQAPSLKQRTLRERRERKNYQVKEGKKGNEKILQNYLKKQILEEAVGKSSEPVATKTGSEEIGTAGNSQSADALQKKQEKDIYDLPPLASQLENSDDENFEEEWNMRSELYNEYYDESGSIDASSVLSMNVDSTDFNSLPSDVQYELLKDLKEIRKRRRTRLEAMPEESNSFSTYQIAGLLAKRKITKKMERVEKKMSEDNVAASSLHAGFDEDSYKTHDILANQLVSDSTSHYVWMTKRAKKGEEVSETASRQNPCAESQDIPSNAEKKLPDNHRLPPIFEAGDGSEEEVTSSFDHTSSLGAKNEFEENHNARETQSSRCSVDTTVPAAQSIDSADSNLPDHENALDTGDESNFKKIHETAPVRTVLSETRLELMRAQTTPTPEPTFDPPLHLSNTEVEAGVAREVLEQQSAVLDTSNAQSNIGKRDDVVIDLTDGDDARLEKKSGGVSDEDIVIKDTEQNRDTLNAIETSSDEEFVEVKSGMIVKEPQTVQVTDDSDKQQTDYKEVLQQPDDGATVEKEEPHPTNLWDGLDMDDAAGFGKQLDAESAELRKMVQAKERASRDLSHSAQLECQELLKLFGLPFIISPQEAEAQCAALEIIGLTGGTITEDSDIWLFGGRYVIKNMFSSKSDPVSFDLADVEMRLGLDRDRFICVAMCSGSDYTTGIDGVGPVTAMEILKEFQGEGIAGLKDLKKWWQDACSNPNVVAPTETKIKSQLRRINLKKDFPSEAVYKAYICPVVDERKSKFEWGFPDLDELRSFATNIMGWTRHKVDETLLPVVKKMGERRSKQSKITHFIPVARNHQGTKRKSKRVLRAVAALKSKPAQSFSEQGGKRAKKSPRKAKAKLVDNGPKLSESSSDD